LPPWSVHPSPLRKRADSDSAFAAYRPDLLTAMRALPAVLGEGRQLFLLLFDGALSRTILLLMAFDQVRDVKFLGSPKPRLGMEGRRNVLTFRLPLAGKPIARGVKLGTFYPQEGSLWRTSSCQTSRPFEGSREASMGGWRNWDTCGVRADRIAPRCSLSWRSRRASSTSSYTTCESTGTSAGHGDSGMAISQSTADLGHAHHRDHRKTYSTGNPDVSADTPASVSRGHAVQSSRACSKPSEVAPS
jgi:hypothetical protein